MSSPSQSIATTGVCNEPRPTLPPLRSIFTQSLDNWNPIDSEMGGISCSTPAPVAPMILHAPLQKRMGDEKSPSQPNQPARHRTRKAKTKEIMLALEDNRGLIGLGITPFMPGQDPISNQNRLVRNETIFARHLSNLQKTHLTSETAHAQRMEHVYRILSDHKGSIDLLKSASSANCNKTVRSDPEYVALAEAHAETRKLLEDLVKDIASFSEITKQAINALTQSIHVLSNTQNANPQSNSPPSAHGSTITNPAVSIINRVSSVPPLSEYGSMKRRRIDSVTFPTSSDSTAVHNPALTQTSVQTISHPLPHANAMPQKNISKEVIYGPITDKSTGGDLSVNADAIGNDAVIHVGLCQSMIHTVRPAPGWLGYILLSFLKADYASKFVDLVSFGLDKYPERLAVFSDQTQGTPGKHQP